MTQRVVAGVSAIVFALVAVMAHLLVSFHDHGFPVALDPASRITLVFSEAAEGDAATGLLRSAAAEAGVELVRMTADLDRNLRGKVFVSLTEGARLPSTVGLYDPPPARVVGPDALAHLSPSGTYLVLGAAERVPSFVAALEGHGVQVSRADPSLGDALLSLLFIRGFLLAFVAACVMAATLALYWLAARAPSRALRVLGGTPVRRIQVHDLVRLLLLVASGGLAVLGVSTLVIGWWKGWLYVPLYIEYFAVLAGLILTVLGAAALVLSGAAIPSPDLIARRQPATLGARRAADGLKGVAFLLLLLMIGPAWLAVNQAVTKAAQLRHWEALGDQVILWLAGLRADEDDERIMPSVGALVHEAEAGSGVALSMLFRDEPGVPHPWVSDALGGRWSSFALVNQRWLDLALDEADRGRLERVPPQEVQSFIEAFARQFGAWRRSMESAESLLASYDYFTPRRGSPVPLIGPGGSDLVHLDDVLLVVVPGVWATFNDSTLLSIVSGGELLFTGLDQTVTLVESHGLASDLKVRRAAEAGILAAQFASFDAWLSGASMVVLGTALVSAAGISAYLMALLRARHDFARRLAGQPWLRVVQRRVLLDAVPGVGLAALVVLIQPAAHTLPILVVAAAAALLSPVIHVVASRTVFADVRARRL